ncbi:MAG: hypothetical protein LBJ95_01795 [Oscillospiraceae bacterium]|nr:hypothetical protein [Oscillospiraceae bacterium]
MSFSSANLTMLVVVFVLVITQYVSTIDIINYYPAFTIPANLIGFGCLSAWIFYKFPLFVKQEPEKNIAHFQTEHHQELKRFNRLYLLLFFSEPSRFISFFSKVTLHVFSDKNMHKFMWKNEKAKFVHRVLDFLIMALLTPFAFLLAFCVRLGDWRLGLVIFLFSGLYIFKELIFSYSMSINIGKAYGYDVNITYPCKAKASLLSYYGRAYPFKKTILISKKTYKNDEIEGYIIANEKGHLEDNKHTFIIFATSLLLVAFLTIGPFLLSSYFGHSYFACLPLILYYIYTNTVHYKLTEQSEQFADAFAVKTIGKEKCLKALNFMRGDTYDFKPSLLSILIFGKIVTPERKIELINEHF